MDFKVHLVTYLTLLLIPFTLTSDNQIESSPKINNHKTTAHHWLYTPKHLSEANTAKPSNQKPWRPFAAGELLMHGTNHAMTPPLMHRSMINHNVPKYDRDKVSNKLEEGVIDRLQSTLFSLGNLVLSDVIGAIVIKNKTDRIWPFGGGCKPEVNDRFGLTINPTRMYYQPQSGNSHNAGKVGDSPGSQDSKFDEEDAKGPTEIKTLDEKEKWIDEGRRMAIRLGQLMASASQLMEGDFLKKLSPQEKKEYEAQKKELKELQAKQDRFWRDVKHMIKFGAS